MSITNVTLFATAVNGFTYELTAVKSLQILAGIDSPAVSLTVSFAYEAFPPEFVSIKAYDRANLLFSGKIDSQKSTVSGSGAFTVLQARNSGALLLDNQALPCVILGARLDTVFGRFIAPYAFISYCARPAASIPMFTVRSGMSEWDVIVNFSQRAYGVTPYVTASTVNFSRRPTKSPLVISNSGDGLNFSEITHTLTPYNIISKIYIRDDAGTYSANVSNGSAARMGTIRKRYIIPATEYASNLKLDATLRIRSSMFDAEELVVTLPYILDTELGQEIHITDNLMRRFNLMVVKRELILDEHGAITRLTLASSIYYD